MAPIIRGYLKLMDILESIVKWVSIVFIAVMTCVVLLQVFTRMLPPVPTPSWTEELARYLMIYAAFMGASIGIKQWDNIGVDFFTNRMPPRVARALELVIMLCVLAFLVYLSYLSMTVFPKVGLRQKSPTMNFPMLVPQSAIIVGSVLMSLQMVGTILRRFTKGGGAHA